MPPAQQLPPLTDLGAGIVQLRLPMTGNPLGYINGYLVEENDGYTLVDCGWKADDVLAALHAGLAQLGRSLADVKRVAITHAHYDHYGLAGTLVRAGVPELVMHPVEWTFAERHFSDPIEMDRIADAWIAKNGFHLHDVVGTDLPHHRADLIAPTRTLDDGQHLGRLRAVWTPGHTPGHLCFIDEPTGRMLTGDHILDPITPHVGVWFPERGDPIGEYVASLAKCRTLGATGVLPAHGEPFPDLIARVDALLEHEAERERQVVTTLALGDAMAADVARMLRWTSKHRAFEDLSEAHQQFAVAETLAHCEHLRARGVATRSEGLVYSLAA
jgi:glyoxylase-like metal-dependent hydrolase (beta-lactamase superfamily II)